MRALCLSLACVVYCAYLSPLGYGAESQAESSDSDILLSVHKQATKPVKAQCTEETCTVANPTVVDGEDRSFGTAIQWAKDPEEAHRLAERESKLVYILHLSGNFEKSQFT